MPKRLVVLVMLALGASNAGAQTDRPAPTPPGSPAVSWSAAAGYESFRLRDVSRTGPPVDASPVAWAGGGLAFSVRHDRARPGRLHRFELALSSAGGFSFDTPVDSIPRPAGDRVTRLDGRYEYRRYPFRDLGARGFDLGVGVQGIGDYLWLTRRIEPSLALRQREVQLGAAVVVAARLRRWSRLDLEAAWSNAAVIARTHERHSADALATLDAWGGGWLTELALTADVAIARRAAVRVSYLRSRQGRLSSHDSNATGRDRLTVGVTYGG